MHTVVNGLELLRLLYEEVEVACNSVERENVVLGSHTQKKYSQEKHEQSAACRGT